MVKCVIGNGGIKNVGHQGVFKQTYESEKKRRELLMSKKKDYMRFINGILDEAELKTAYDRVMAQTEKNAQAAAAQQIKEAERIASAERKKNLAYENQIKSLEQRLKDSEYILNKYKKDLENAGMENKNLQAEQKAPESREERKLGYLEKQVQELKDENCRLKAIINKCVEEKNEPAVMEEFEKEYKQEEPFILRTAFISEYPNNYNFDLIRRYFPDSCMVSEFDTSKIENAKLVVLLTKNNSHKLYGVMKEACKKWGIPCLHCDCTNAEKIWDCVKRSYK